MRNISLIDLKGKHKESIASLRKAGFEKLEDLFMVDMPHISRLTSIPEADLKKILLSAELQSYGVSPDVSDILADSGVIARAGELTALDKEDIKVLLTEGVKPDETFKISTEEIERIKAMVPRLTLGQEAAKAYTFEDDVAPIHYETVPALISEEPIVSTSDVESLVTDLEKVFRLFHERIMTLASKSDKPIESNNMKALIASLQADIESASTKILSKIEPFPELTRIEGEVSPFMDERIELDVQMKDISNKILVLQNQLSALKTQRGAADEDLSATIAEEKEPIAPRGEEPGRSD